MRKGVAELERWLMPIEKASNYISDEVFTASYALLAAQALRYRAIFLEM